MIDEETLMETVRELRKALGMTQIQFSVKIGKSYPSVQRYEGTRPPKGRDLVQFLELARKCERYDLAKILKQAAIESIPEDLMQLIRDKGPEDDYTPRKETSQQSSSYKRKIRA